jgi:2-haloacid dehalogenase
MAIKQTLDRKVMQPKMLVNLTAVLLTLSVIAAAQANPGRPRFKAVAFDYFVLFDPSSIEPVVERELPGNGKSFTQIWQARQFEYAFLHSITGRYRNFFDVTGDALDYTAQSLHLHLSIESRQRLLNAYLRLSIWPDTKEALKKLRAAGVRIITIANLTPMMLKENAENAEISGLFDELLSTDFDRKYKPDPRAYELGTKHLNLSKKDILFAAFGGWDVFGAKSFGYTTFWVNRFDLPAERLGLDADGTAGDLSGLLEFVLGEKNK